MRNGIYRVWVKGPEARYSSAVVLRDGDLIACNPSFGFFGRYRVAKGQFSADISCRRVSNQAHSVNFPDLDAFQLALQGQASQEFANLTGTIAEVPGFSLSFEFAWLCEA